MRIVVASSLFLLLFLCSFLSVESSNKENLKINEDGSGAVVMIKHGMVIKVGKEKQRNKLSEAVFAFQSIEEKRIVDHNKKRLDHYKPRLENYKPPKGNVSILVTGYSSTPDQTWGDPFTTASGTTVHKGTMACPPQYPFGTKIKIQSMGTFICEDRGGMIKGNHFDMWFESRIEALNWGKRMVSAEIAK